MRSQDNDYPITNRESSRVLATAGQMTLTNSNSKSVSPHKLMQQINDDDQFMQLPNIKTTFLDQNGNRIQHGLSSDTVVQKIAPRMAGQKEFAAGGLSSSHNRFKNKAKLQVDSEEYDNVASQIRKNALAVSQTNRKKQKKTNYLDDEDQLLKVEQIISQIQGLMDSSLNSKFKSPFKHQITLSKHSDKKNWHNKGIHKFNQNQGINKLEEMLLHYKLDDKESIFAKETQPKQDTIKSAGKKDERINRIKQYNQISKSLINSESPRKKGNNLQSDIIPEPPQQPKKKEDKQGKPIKPKNTIQMQNIQILQIDWMKLPIILNELNQQNQDLYLQIRDFPQDESFIDSINDNMKQHTTYSTYSIFNHKYSAGVKKDKTLMSEQQFRQTWAQEWQQEVDEEQTKEVMCELDFQWYRSLVQFTINHNLQEILIKNIKYDIHSYLDNLAKIHGGKTNDKLVTNQNTLPNTINHNKLKFIEALLTKLVKDKEYKENKVCLIIGVVPNIGQAQNQSTFAFLKSDIQTLFKGGLYSTQSQTSTMGVIITQSQAKRANIQKSSTINQVKIDEHIDLLINEPASISKIGNKIVLKRQKQKNSSIRIVLMRLGEQDQQLQVGEQLHYGRKYHILFD